MVGGRTIKKKEGPREKPRKPETEDEECLKPEEAAAEVPKWIGKCGPKPDGYRKCFIYCKEGPGGKKCWKPHRPRPCAHYVAHELVIKVAEADTCDSPPTVDYHCREGYAVAVKDIKKWCLNKKEWEKRKFSEVRERDIYFWKLPRSHIGIVTEVAYNNREPEVKVTHCSTGAHGLKDTWFKGKPSGEFYGPKLYSPKLGFLGNISKKEVHNLNNTQTNCQINEIKCKKKFKTLKKAHEAGYDNCHYCIGGSKR